MGDVLQCKLLQGPSALLAQLILGVLAVCALVYKRYRERPQRPVDVWLLDVTKQVISTGAAHVCGMVIAMIASAHHHNATSECSWYFVAFTFDTTLGVAITIALHKAALALARRGAAAHPKAAWLAALVDCGYYGSPVELWRWALQLIEWTAAVVAARAVVGLLVVAAGGGLAAIASALDGAFEGHPDALLFAVMVACPLCMNTAQLLLQDAVLRWKRAQRGPQAARASTDSAWDGGWGWDDDEVDAAYTHHDSGEAGNGGHGGPPSERTGLLPQGHRGSSGGGINGSSSSSAGVGHRR